MRRKFNKLKKISLFMLAILISSIIGADVQPVKGEVIQLADTIKILEIQPGNKTYLTEDKIQTVSSKVNGRNMEVTVMTMAEFISTSEEVSGKYDIVVIGRKNSWKVSSWIWPFTETKYLPITYTDGNEFNSGSRNKYRDYTNPFSESLQYLPLSSWAINTSDFRANGSTVDGIKFKEYYAENDITNRKADEIISMIDSKQLVIVDNKIFNTDINKTKLYTRFNGISGTNLKKLDAGNITLQNILNQYNAVSTEYKRPQVTKITTPQDDSNGTDIKNRNMVFNVSTYAAKEEQMTAKLYLDINGDGLFKEKELVDTESFNAVVGQNNQTLKYDLDKDFKGSLEWKIDISNSNGAKNTQKGDLKYNTIGQSKQLRVLQIAPYKNSEYDLSQNARFNQLINSTNVSKDYDIDVTCKTVDEVNWIGSNLELNGVYDMIILGFGDSYGTAQINTAVLDKIEEFIKTGQSVMFTHDTITPGLTSELANDVNSSKYWVTGARELTQRFRDFVGQARYVDLYRTKGNNNQIVETDLYKEFDSDTMSLVERIIPHDELPSTMNGYSSLGTALQGKALRRNDRFGDGVSWKFINSVAKVNTGLINQYPYELGETINVATTHTQWYQLNLEDPDVVPWFNLNTGVDDEGDARNFYYTYSKGNITYSGTGHSGGFPDDELKLFVNTIVKADRGANHAPKISTTISEKDGAEEIPIIDVENASYDFITSITDIDNDRVKLIDIVVDGQSIEDENINMNGKKVKGQLINQGQSINVSIPEALYRNKENQVITVKINAEDEMGAKVEKTYKIKPTKLPQIMVTQTNNKGLVGDNIETSLVLTKQNEIEQSKISNVKIEVKDYNSSIMSVKNTSGNIDFTQGSSSNFSLDVTTKAECKGGEDDLITAEISYKVGDISKVKEVKIPVYSRIGKVTVKVQDDNGGLVPLNLTGKLSSSGVNSFNATTDVKIEPSTGCSFTWPSDMVQNSDLTPKKITTNDYSFELKGVPLDTFAITDIKVNGQAESTDSAKINFKADYDNSNIAIVYTVQYKADMPVSPSFTVSSPDPLNKTINYADTDKVTEVKYTIKPDSFDYIGNVNTEEKPIDEVMFVLDLSQAMFNNQRWSQFQNGIVNKIVGNSKLKANYTEVGAVGYKNGAVYAADTRSSTSQINDIQFKEYSTGMTLVNPLFDIGNKTNNNSNDGCQNIFKSVYNMIDSNAESNNKRNIESALKAAGEILNTKASDKTKAVVILSAGAVNYDENSEAVSYLKRQGYKIISLDLSNNNEAETNNKKLHTLIGGSEEDFIKGTTDNGQNYNFVDKDLGKVADSLIAGIGGGSYQFDNVALSFDIGDNFEVIPYEDGNYAKGDVKSSTTVDGRLNITLNDVKYKITSDKGEGVYTHSPADSVYDVSFKIKPKDDKYGELTFNSSNNMIYKRLGEKLEKVHESITAPIINVNKTEITHGVYSGKGNISESSTAFAENALVPMAAKFTASLDTSIELSLDSKGQIVGMPKVYKIEEDNVVPYRTDENGNLISVMNLDDGVYKYYIDKAEQDTEILVLYNYKVTGKNGEYINRIKAYGIEKDAKFASDGELPDLY